MDENDWTKGETRYPGLARKFHSVCPRRKSVWRGAVETRTKRPVQLREQDGARRRKFSWRGPSRHSVAKNARLGLQAPPSFFARAAQCRRAQSSSVHGVKQVHASYDVLRFPKLALSLAINLIRCDHWRCPSRAVLEPRRYFTLLALKCNRRLQQPESAASSSRARGPRRARFRREDTVK